jgi:hypothetical protein
MLQHLFKLAFTVSLISSELAILALENWPGWSKFILVIIVPILLIASILLAEFVMITAGYEGKTSLTGPGYKEKVRGVAGCGLFMFIFIACYPLINSKAPQIQSINLINGSSEDTKSRLEAILVDWRAKLEKISITCAKFEEDRNVLTEKLKANAVATSKDIDKSPIKKRIADEFVELQQQIISLKKRQMAYKEAVEEVQSGIRRLERQQSLESSGFNESELEKLSLTAAELEDRLSNYGNNSERSSVQIDLWLKEALDPAQK